MKNDFFHDLYMSIRDVRVRDCSAMSLSHLLHGYLSVYAMVRVSPTLEREYGTLQEIHGRLREIAKELSKAMKDTSIELDERIGYVADLMDAYQTYSDMDLLNEALDVTYRILTVDEKGEIVIPGRTPNVCRLLCSWYYFTGEEWCLEMAEEVISLHINNEDRLDWIRAVNNLRDFVDKCVFISMNENERLKDELFHMKKNREERCEGIDNKTYYFEVLAIQEYEFFILCERKDLLERYTII